MTTTLNVSEGRGGVLCFDIVGVASVAAGGIGKVANPLGVDIAIIEEFLHIVTPATGAASISIGIGTEAAASSDIISALRVDGAITGKVYQGAADAGAKTEVVPAVWTAAKFLNIAADVTTVALVAKLYLRFIRLDTD